jgi:hypothetical protein
VKSRTPSASAKAGSGSSVTGTPSGGRPGTTGLSPNDFAKLKAASFHARIVQSGNMSLGVNR